MSDIDVLLQENRKFPPPDDFRKQARIQDSAMYEAASRDYESYWADRARELDWPTIEGL